MTPARAAIVAIRQERRRLRRARLEPQHQTLVIRLWDGATVRFTHPSEMSKQEIRGVFRWLASVKALEMAQAEVLEEEFRPGPAAGAGG